MLQSGHCLDQNREAETGAEGFWPGMLVSCLKKGTDSGKEPAPRQKIQIQGLLTFELEFTQVEKDMARPECL